MLLSSRHFSLKCVEEFSIDTGLHVDRVSLFKQKTLRNSRKCTYLKYDEELFGASGQIENKSIDFIKA